MCCSGFHGGDPRTAEYRELMVRWFQFGAFSPIFRLHGLRRPSEPFGPSMTGAPNDEGGRTVTVDAPLERIPLFLRDGAELPIVAAKLD